MANIKLESIFASKLYQTSDRKEEIKTAMKNPINKGLVQQLSEYLDEPVKDEDNKDEDKDIDVKKDLKPSNNTEAEKDNVEESPKKSNMHISRNPRAPKEDTSTSKEDIPQPQETETPTPSTNENSVEESEDIEKSSCGKSRKNKKVNSNVKASMCCVPNFSIDTLVGTLRSNDTTSMVDRARIKDDKELWIFYNDSVNLNDIMNDVIELINSAGYSHLEFNRLARSDNAIVFEFTPESIEMRSEETDDSDEVEIEGVEIGEKAKE